MDELSPAGTQSTKGMENRKRRDSRPSPQLREIEYGHLVTDRAVHKLHRAPQVQITQGQQRFLFSNSKKKARAVSQASRRRSTRRTTSVASTKQTGAGWVTKPKAAAIQEWLKPGDWNEMVITAVGTHITVRVNGQKAVELTNDSLGTPAWQARVTASWEPGR
jgi:hypothetical protein